MTERCAVCGKPSVGHSARMDDCPFICEVCHRSRVCIDGRWVAEVPRSVVDEAAQTYEWCLRWDDRQWDDFEDFLDDLGIVIREDA